MAHLSLGRLGAVFDFREQFGLDPDALMSDSLGVGLGFTDQGREALTQLGGGSFVETVVDLAGIDQVVTL